MKKRILLNAVEMASPIQDNAGMWRVPEDASARYKDLDYWIELAQLLEKGRFDTVFFADILGVYDIYKGGRDTSVQEGLYVPINDPTYAVPAMASVTEHLGFGVTSSITYDHPYAIARKFSTLDHLTNGRIAWNIVTSNLDSAARNFGLTEQIPHDKRYDRGDEFLEVTYQLWNTSWEENAVVRDRENRVYTQADKVHEIHHTGEFFKVNGIHLCEPSPQRTPVIFQAGSSDRGRDFAAKHAECIFLNPMTVEETAYLIKDTRQRAEGHGRSKDDILFFPKINPIVGKTDEEVQAKLAQSLEYSSAEGALSLLSAWTGMDFADFNAEQLLSFITKGEARSGSNYLAEFFERNHHGSEWTKEELAKYFAFGGVGSLLAGTPVQIADRLELFLDETDADGFNVAFVHRYDTFKDFVELVVPELQKRGRVQLEYEEGTFRHKLFGRGPHLPQTHIGQQWNKGVKA